MTELARRYAEGIGCPRDAGQAMLWYRRAAQEGEPGAMVAIGDMLEEGRCVDQDFVGCSDLVPPGSEYRVRSGDGPACNMLERGRGAQIDREEAHEWYRKAAKLGYGPAMTRLGDLEGNVEWYKKAVATMTRRVRKTRSGHRRFGVVSPRRRARRRRLDDGTRPGGEARRKRSLVSKGG